MDTRSFNRNTVKKHFDGIAGDYDGYKQQNKRYYREIKNLIREKMTGILPDKVLEIGCGTGNLLVGLPGNQAVGGDLSMEMVRTARTKWAAASKARFIVMAAEELPFKPLFDFILMVDLLEHVVDPVKVLEQLRFCARAEARILITVANPLWTPILHYAERKKLKMPEGPHRWHSLRKLKKACADTGLEIADSGYRLLLPAGPESLAAFINRMWSRLPLFNRLCLIQYLVLHAK